MTRTVAVTGGARGIGRAVVGRFVEAGDRAIALGRDQITLSRLEVETRVCDVTDEDGVAATFAGLGALVWLIWVFRLVALAWPPPLPGSASRPLWRRPRWPSGGTTSRST